MAEYRIEPNGFLSYLIKMNEEERSDAIITIATNMVAGKSSKAKWLTKIKNSSISKKSNNQYSNTFLDFWKKYPKKTGKGAAFAVWAGFGMDNEKECLTMALTALEWQLESKEWRSGYIPLPETYLRQRRFEDEPDNNSNDPKGKMRKAYG